MTDKLVLETLERIEKRLAKLEEVSAKPSNLDKMYVRPEIGIALETIDETLSPTTTKGKDNIEKVEKLKELVEILSHKESIDSLVLLADSLKNVSTYMGHLNQVENGISITADALDDFFGKAIKNGLNIEKLSTNLKHMNYLLLDLVESGSLNELLESGILKQSSIKTVGTLGQSMAVSSQAPRAVSLMTIIKALFDKDIRRSIGFAINLATHFGRGLEKKK